MALLSEAIKEKEFDVRMVQRGLNKGLLLQDDVQKHLKKLSDENANADYVNVDELRQSVDGQSGLRD